MSDTIKCIVCDTVFEPKSARAKYCSEACKQRNKRARARPSEVARQREKALSKIINQPRRPNPLAVSLTSGTPKSSPVPSSTRKSPAKLVEELRAQGYDARLASDIPPITYVTTGIPELDALTRFPRKRVTEIYGPASVGKTTLATMCVVGMSHSLKLLYIDMENTFNPERAAELGATPENIIAVSPPTLEEAADLMIRNVGSYDVIIFDSVAGAQLKREAVGTSETGEANVGLKARVMGSFMRRLVPPLAKSDCAAVFINQERATVDFYGPRKFTPGGVALSYASSIRVNLTTTKADRITRGGEVVGHKVTAEITKNKVGRPYTKTQFEVLY